MSIYKKGLFLVDYHYKFCREVVLADCSYLAAIERQVQCFYSLFFNSWMALRRLVNLQKWPELSGQKNSNKDSTILNLQSIHDIFWISIYINIIYLLNLNLFSGKYTYRNKFLQQFWNFYMYPIETSIFHGSVDFDGWYISHTKLYFSEIPWFIRDYILI